MGRIFVQSEEERHQNHRSYRRSDVIGIFRAQLQIYDGAFLRK